jgi:hypothetical protein
MIEEFAVRFEISGQYALAVFFLEYVLSGHVCTSWRLTPYS